ncbi:MAG: VOC family protein [Rhodospirillales bacterium]|nr:VOC family protein [Rhodospirillales bacterium]
MSLVLPVPTFDHVVVNARDRLDAAADTYRRLGFTLTPRGYHTLGSMNHLAIFGTDYLELIAVRPGDASRPEVMAAREGLNGLVFGMEDAARTEAVLREAGVPVSPFMQFSRPVELPSGAEDAAFRTVHLAPGSVPAGRVYFCQHLTRHLVWRDEWRHHANGTVGVAGAVIAAADPAPLAALFGRMFGAAAVHPVAGGFRVVVGLATLDLLTETAARDVFGAGTPADDGRESFMAGLVLRTTSLDRAAQAFAAGGVTAASHAGRLVVPAEAAFGAALAFQD